MRERNLLYVFLVLNVALAGAFIVYLFVSTSGQPNVQLASFGTNNAGQGPKWTNNLKAAATVTNAASRPPTNTAPVTNTVAEAPAPKPVFTQKKFTWEDVETDAYKSYVESLRAVGCPEDKIRTIIKTDIDELFLKKKKKLASETDRKWWTAEYSYAFMVNSIAEKGQHLEEERRDLLAKLLGMEATQKDDFQNLQWGPVELTGPVLGNLVPKIHNEVQEICARSQDRQMTYQMDKANTGQPMNPIEMAKLREQTRIDLRKILTPDEVEEFTLRYSHNAHNLRGELRGFDPTAEEFRKIFRGIDPLEHQMALEYGSPEAMSEKQRERFLRQRENAIKEALAPNRYEAFLMTKDPLFRQAQMTASQYGAPSKVVMPIYQMTKLNETKRQKILGDNNLSQQQKNEALSAVNMDQQRFIQQIVNEANTRQQQQQ
jgi:hypothetical protein